MHALLVHQVPIMFAFVFHHPPKFHNVLVSLLAFGHRVERMWEWCPLLKGKVLIFSVGKILVSLDSYP